MTTLACTITPTGIYAPDYADIYAQLQVLYWGIYGSDADLDPDSQDGQFLAIFAQAIYDCNQVAVAVYNSFLLDFAQGTGLSSIVKLVGVRRQTASYSTDTLQVNGVYGTTINNGQAGDDLNQGTIWSLPPVVNIPESGTIEVTITASEAGSQTFANGEITAILTPTAGWQSATNVGPQVPGAPVQLDASLRQQAAASTAGPASTVLAAISAAVGNVANVQRYIVYENDTEIDDANGQGPHSIYAVVEGGTIQDVVNAIGQTKSPGTTTLGTTSGIYVDPSGVPNTINYYQLDVVQLDVVVVLAPLAGYTSASATAIQQAIAQFLTSLPISTHSYLNRLFAPANLSGDAATEATGLTQAQLDALSATFNVTSIEQCLHGGTPEAADIPITFDEAAACLIANVTVNT